MSGGQKALFYILSILIPIVGIILGIIWMNDPEPEKKVVGKNCLIIAIVVTILSCICWFAASALSIMPAVSGY
ncbi:hypothetical protein J7E81_19540 [Bacillus sp. ISL-18]|uniref:hypothetical protein n=1 Tax=Bacillus sp. ISL-18 TaxID=2819118 RepID=UPI001BE9BA5C|nr:hypothetical protein [Bacillus sp. ISL-18]MBT2657394.1 hypothetical protein [Bacillus sp. ISL-18]